MAKRMVILGAGESGVGAALLAKAKGYEVFVSDASLISDRYRKVLEQHQIEFEQGFHSEEKILNASEVVKSPGISEKNELIQKIRTTNIPIISEIELGFRYTRAKIIAITGSNGKTTTTLLTYYLLKSGGLNVGLAGNIGESFAKQVVDAKYDYFVLEVSSFQLDDCKLFKPYIAVLLNITPDHLDRYEYKLENYVQSKFRIIQSQDSDDFLIYNADNHLINEQIALKKPVASKLLVTLSPSEEAFKSAKTSYLSGNEILARMPYNRAYQISLTTKDIVLKGEHNVFNAMCAILVSQILGISDQSILISLKTFKNAPHRLEEVAEIRGITFVNDSKATNVDSVYYGLGSFAMQTPQLVWIAGGVDKGNDYTQIDEMVAKKVKKMICLGKDNSKLIAHFGKIIPYVEVQNMQEALAEAYRSANVGDTVLLSPACASFDLFKNYEDRGEQFKKAVQELHRIVGMKI
jgi:UDP-N-acetylmuramoylalanine--D-glutamate ligase